ncbi:hypothetical protein RND81_07G022300 [Saponaria officinalis]|uniref:Uncharacterized protein n=1 Tax=Saponaria officinalis TaxID=3572 RepID=A0AAW1JK81_SAPOF
MSHAIVTGVTPMHVTTNIMSRDTFTFFNPSHQSAVTKSPWLTVNGGLLVGLCNRRSLGPAHVLNGLPSVDLGNNLGLSDFVEIELKVRDYEVDQYGVVNNAVYSSYCQHAHHELLVSFGMNLEGTGRSQPIAVSDLSFKFLAPLRNRDKFVLKSRVSHFSLARIFIEHFIYKLPNYEPILEAKSTLVWLDESHRPVRIPSDLKYKLTQLGLYK